MALVTINNKEIQADDGSLILDVARESGFHIPTFCYHAKLSKLGSCRMCLVEIEGMRKLQPSCVTPVMEGMKIQTESESVVKARKSQLEFLLINHPLDCPVCDQAGECDLQDLTFKFGNKAGRYRWEKRTFPQRDMGPVITKEMNRCIACRRCSRYCAEISGDYAISELNRGNYLEMGTFCHTPVEGEFLGNTIQLCPVGALTSSHFRFSARVWDLKSTETICPHCSVGCSITSDSKNNKVYRNMATEDKGVTEISICARGRFGHSYIHSDERIASPMIKEGGVLVETTWGKALDYVAAGFTKVRETHGTDAIGGATSGFSSNEEAYLFQKLFRKVLGTNNIDICRSYTLDPDSMLRLASMKGRISDVKNADTILVLGSSVSTETPIISMNAGIAARMQGARLITMTAGENRLITSGPERIAYCQGKEDVIIGALTKCIIENRGYIPAFDKERKDELVEIRSRLKDINLEKLEQISGVSKESLTAVATAMAGASKGVLLFGDDFISPSNRSVSVINALYTLGEITGFNGEKGRSIYSPAAANLTGSSDMGVSPHYFPGYKRVENKAAAEKIGLAWGAVLPRDKGLSWDEMITSAIEGDLKALYIMDADPAGPAFDAGRVKGGLGKLDFLVVQGMFMTETARLADVVLPPLSYSEKGGTLTNLEGRVQKLATSIPAFADSRDAWKIIWGIARAMGEVSNYGSIGEVTEEISRLVSPYDGIRVESLPRNGVFADYSNVEKPAAASAEVALDLKEIEADEDYPFSVLPGKDVFLTYGRGLADEGLMKLSPAARLLVSEADGARLGLRDGAQARLETSNGSIECAVRLTENVAEGVVVVPVNRPDLDTNSFFEGSWTGTKGRLIKRA